MLERIGVKKYMHDNNSICKEQVHVYNHANV